MPRDRGRELELIGEETLAPDAPSADLETVDAGPLGPEPPERSDSRLSPARFRLAISFVLSTGVAISAALIGFGLITGLLFGWETSIIGATVTATATTSFGSVVAGLLAVQPIAFAQAGLLVLLATPVVRVAASFVGFALERDRLYVGVSVTVLIVLLGSIFLLR
jgi:uncharacterized membrane protein